MRHRQTLGNPRVKVVMTPAAKARGLQMPASTVLPRSLLIHRLVYMSTVPAHCLASTLRSSATFLRYPVSTLQTSENVNKGQAGLDTSSVAHGPGLSSTSIAAQTGLKPLKRVKPSYPRAKAPGLYGLGQ